MPKEDSSHGANKGIREADSGNVARARDLLKWVTKPRAEATIVVDNGRVAGGRREEGVKALITCRTIYGTMVKDKG